MADLLSRTLRSRFMRLILALIFSLCVSNAVAAAEPSFYDFTLTGIDGKPMALSQFKGHPVLLVNTASECGYTPQYEGLEKLYLDYKDKGLVIVGVPSNDFGGQEPGKATEIASFCKLNYGVTFPLADKTVVTGDAADPLYVWAGNKAGMLGRPTWNFHKYLFGRDGQFVDWFSTPTKPESAKIVSAVEAALAEK
jgi:glutathione peroxidase